MRGGGHEHDELSSERGSLDEVDPFFMALLRSRQRRFVESIDICTEILSVNPYDQVQLHEWLVEYLDMAAWVTKTKALTSQSYIDDSELEEDGAADLLMDDNVMASMPRPDTSLNRPNTKATRVFVP